MTKRAQNTSLLKRISVSVIVIVIVITTALNMKSPSVKPGKVTTELIIDDIAYRPFEITTYDDMIEYWCMVYEVDSNLATAIARLETGHYTSEVFTECNNFGGMIGSKGFMEFRNSMEGCEAFVGMLKYGYIDQGLDTPEKMQPKYCPVNPQWSTLVRSLMN